MYKIEYLNDATKQIKKLVNDILDANPTQPGKVKDFISDLEKTFEKIQKKPELGTPIEDTSYKNIRRIHLEHFSQIMIIFTEEDNIITVISVMIYWLPS